MKGSEPVLVVSVAEAQFEELELELPELELPEPEPPEPVMFPEQGVVDCDTP